MSKTKKMLHVEKMDRKKIELIGLVSFLLGFSQSILLYVMSSYFKEASGTDNVGIFYFVAHVLALIGMLNLYRFIKRYGKARLFLLFISLQVTALAFLANLESSWIGIGFMIAFIVISDLVVVALDVILETYSEDRSSGRIRGFHLMLVSAGFLLGPLISTRILETYGFHALFLSALLLSVLVFIVSLLGLRGANHRVSHKFTLKDLTRKIFANKDLMNIYGVSLALEFFYALMIVFAPLYLLDQGLSWDQIGIIFTVMLVPFVLLEYPIGLLADKKFGEKEMILLSLAIVCASTAGIYFINGTSLVVWSTILFCTRVGAAALEVLRDSYFYKKIDGNDVDEITFFRSARPVAYVLAAGLSATFLLFIPIEALFLVVASGVALAFIPALRLRNNYDEAESAVLARQE